MKKRTGVFALLALTLAVVLPLGLFGCGDPENGGVEGGGKVTETTDPAKIISQKMSEEQWKEAFSKENYENFSAKETGTTTMNGTTSSGTTISKVDGDKMHIKATLAGGATAQEMELYMSFDNSKVTVFMYDSSTQKWTTLEQDLEQYYGSDLSSLITVAYRYFGTHYADFTYDDTTKAYTAAAVTVTEADIDGAGVDIPEGGLTLKSTYTDVTLKFIDGKVSYAKYSLEGDASMGGVNMTASTTNEQIFYDYGETSVTLPTVAA